MDVFRLLDEAVRGTVDFIYDLVRTSVTLATRPISGPLELWRDYRRPGAQQVSPLTYLTLIFVVAAFAYADRSQFGNEGPGSNLLAGFAAMLTTGSITTAIVPVIAGAVAASVLIDLLLRLFGLLLPSGLRRERFVGVMEYEIGFFLLVVSGSVLVQDFATGDLGLALVMAPFYAAAFVMAVHFYAQLRRTPRWYRLTHSWLRRVRDSWRAGPRSWWSWLLGRVRDFPGTAKFLGIGYVKLFVGFFLLMPPFLVIVAGLLARDFATGWLLKEQRPTATVTLLELRCDLARAPMSARAIAWNSSAKPAVNWLGGLRLEIVDALNEPVTTLQWRARWTDARDGDLLRPGEVAVLEGPLAGWKPTDRPVGDGLECRSAPAQGPVVVRSERR